MDSDTKPTEELKKPIVVADDVSVTKEPAMVVVGRRELPTLLRDLSPDELKALEKKLVRKVDLRLLPMMILVCKY